MIKVVTCSLNVGKRSQQSGNFLIFKDSSSENLVAGRNRIAATTCWRLHFQPFLNIVLQPSFFIISEKTPKFLNKSEQYCTNTTSTKTQMIDIPNDENFRISFQTNRNLAFTSSLKYLTPKVPVK